jgi:predicted phage terminase large subunit-like protein
LTSSIISRLPPPQTPTSSLSRSQAAALLLHRRAIRTNLEAWCIEALSAQDLRPAKHHRILLDRLEAIERGDIRRLMVLMPPGSAKSTYASILFTAWYLARHPEHSVIAASHTAELAERFGRRVRNIIIEHSAALGIGVSPDNAAAGQWGTTAGGEYFAAGILGPITGRRADLAIIDDPVKSRQEADSEIVSDRIWEWWKADLSTRLKPGAKVVLIMTRWSETDLGGRVLDDMATGGAPWEVLRLPMEAEPGDPLGREVGEPLWPEWFTDDMRKEAKRDTRTWSALYQQAPAPDTGDYFRRDWLRSVAKLPPRESLRIFGGSDYAVTADGGDYTVHVVVGVDADDRLYVLDLWRGQSSSDVWVEAFCDLVIRWKPMGWAEETGQIRAGIGPWLDRRQRERRAYVAREAFPTRGDKAVRAQSIRGRAALSGLYVPVDAVWRTDLEIELLSFPAGRHDDQVDALGLVGQLLDVMIAPGRPAAPPPRVDSWDKAFRRGADDGEDSWKVA